METGRQSLQESTYRLSWAHLPPMRDHTFLPWGIHIQAFLGSSPSHAHTITWACYSHRNKNTLYVGIFLPKEAPKSLCACSVIQLCPTLCNHMNISPPGSSVHGILQTKIPEWIPIFSFRGSSPSKDQTHASCVSCTGRQILYHWAT